MKTKNDTLTQTKERVLNETREARNVSYAHWKDSRQYVLETIAELKPILDELTTYMDSFQHDLTPQPSDSCLAKLPEILRQFDQQRQTLAYFSALERRATEATDKAYTDLYGEDA